MKLKSGQRLLAATKFVINNKYGSLEYNWKSDLEDEEYPGYIPDGYSKTVLELSYLIASELNKGYGSKLMNTFLNSPQAKKAELIFLDPNPDEGLFENSGIPEREQINRLIRFYGKFGFRHAPGSTRMWLVRRGTIPDNKLPK
jgi:hypothetical protein